MSDTSHHNEGPEAPPSAPNTTESPALTENPEAAMQMSMMLQAMLEQMANKFELMSQQIIGKIDDMGKRIDDIETQMADKMKAVKKAEKAEK